jgi:mannose-1-phosphate guanylyltransferase
MYPKQFINFFNGKGSLLAASLRRIDGSAFAAPVVICNNDHRFLVREELARTAIAPEAIILEPVARNTAAAVAVAALAAVAKSSDAIIAVMPSDHIVKDTQNFVASLERAAPRSTGQRVAMPSTRSSRSPTRPRRNPTSPTATISGTAASSCCTPARSSTSWSSWHRRSWRRHAPR